MAPYSDPMHDSHTYAQRDIGDWKKNVTVLLELRSC